MNKLNQYKHFILLSPFVLVMLLQFNNCSKYQQPEITAASTAGGGGTSSGSSGVTKTGDLCEDTIKELFAQGYYPFVRQNCTQCHSTDSSRPQFANPDVNWAYTVFQSRGYTKVSSNAISPTHQPPSTGIQHTQEINELKIKWQQGLGEYNTCKGLPPETTTVNPNDILTMQTSSLKIPALKVDEEFILRWDLTNGLILLKPNLTAPNMGASSKFSIKVTRRQNAAKEDYYTFRDPIIYSNATDVKVKTMYVKLNSRLVAYPSTFKFVDKELYAGSTETGDNIGLLSTGGLVALGTVSDQDYVNIAFEKMEPITLGPRPLPVTVGFTSNNVQVISASNPSLRDISFEVSTNVNSDVPVVVSVDVLNDSLCGVTGDTEFTLNATTCLPNVLSKMTALGLNDPQNLKFKKARSVVDGGDYNRFDWDFKVINNTFNLFQTANKGNVVIKFSTDLRRETNRVLRLRVTVASANAKTSPTTSDIAIIIQKLNNPLPAFDEVTFSSLMRIGTGVLGVNCVKCHNSRDLNGGYDMTNFDLMLTKRVLIQDANNPDFAADNSKMFSRMNPQYPGNNNLSPMPLDGFLTNDLQIDRVRQWIRSGAKNN